MTPRISTRLRLGVEHLEHVLERQRLEVQAIAGVVVGGDGLGVAVDHDGLVAGIRQRERRVHARVVELDALADAVGARADDHDLGAIRRRHLGLEVVARVVVGRERRELPRARVDRLVDGSQSEGMTDAAHVGLGESPTQLRHLGIAEAVLLRDAQGRGIQLTGCADEFGDFVDEHDLVEEPRVDAGRLEQLLDRGALAQRLLHDDDAAVGRALRHREEIVDRARLVAPVEAGSALLERAERLLERGGVVAADRHRLAHRLHGGGERRVGGRELLEVEPGHLHHDVVERRLEARRGDLRDVVRDLVEAVADRELGGDLRDREAGGLRRERRRARHARVHLDDDDAAGRGVDGELDVAAAGVDAHGADDVDADVAELLVLAVGERQRRGDRDGVAGVHADGVDVLDRADDDRVVGGVAHELELVLLPPEDRLLEEHLVGGRVVQTRARDAAEVATRRTRSRSRVRPS